MKKWRERGGETGSAGWAGPRAAGVERPPHVGPCVRGSRCPAHPPAPAAEEKKKLAEEKAAEIEEQNKVIAVEKAEAETVLAEVMPILEAAKLELQKLDKSDVTEIR